MTKSELVERIFSRLPHPTKIDLEGEAEAIRFTCGEYRIRVQLSLFVEEVRDGMLVSSTVARLIERLLRI